MTGVDRKGVMVTSCHRLTTLSDCSLVLQVTMMTSMHDWIA